MPRYAYTAKSSPDKTTQGTIVAESEADAVGMLTRTGLYPLVVRADDPAHSTGGITRLARVSKTEVALFTCQLSTLIGSGIGILNGLNIIASQAPNKQFRLVLRDIISKIQNGQSFSASLGEYPGLFPALYTAMVRTGEMSGNLNQTLARLADFMDKEEEFASSVRAALTYPAFVFVVGLGTILVLLFFVIPRLVSMFQDMGQVLPLPTQILINTSAFLQHYGWMLFAAAVAAGFFLRRLYLIPQGRLLWDSVQLKLPLVGAIAMKTEISRLARTLSLLIASALPVTTSLDIAKHVLHNRILADAAEKLKTRIAGGSRFSESLKDSRLFDDFVINIIAIGEETGALDKALSTISADYERDVDAALKLFARLLEPVLILVMGAVVGFIVLSMLLPIFQINLMVS